MSCRRLEGRSALITGAASGVGRASTIGLFDLNAGNLEVVAAEVAERGAKPLTYVGDVADTANCRESISRMVAEGGRLDILVSNAPAHSAAPFLEMTVEEWDRVMAVMLRASFVLGQLAARVMAADGKGGSINYTASISAIGASVEYAHYGAAKAGIVNLAKTMALELVSKRIRVNTVSPGP